MTGRVAASAPVRCALVGVGVLGSEHAEILASSPAADLAICCDVDPADHAVFERYPGGIVAPVPPPRRASCRRTR